MTKPDDWHVHLRDGDYLAQTGPATAQHFGRAIIMPNLVPPVTTVAQASAYRERILAATAHTEFQPLMTLYLTEQITIQTIKEAKQSGLIYAVKLYPAGATTNAEFGIKQLDTMYPIFAAMEEADLPLLIHGEITQGDIFEREAQFIETVLVPLIQTFPNLRIVLEHITTQFAAAFIGAQSTRVAATITPHHLWCNRNDLLVGGVKPDYYCLPILKTATDQQALIKAATSGDPHFFLGTDSAPHSTAKKYCASGCAGIYNSEVALACYATVFEQANALDKLEAFASHYGADFYQLPRNKNKITLQQKSWQVPENLPFGKEQVTPFLAGKKLNWQVVHD